MATSTVQKNLQKIKMLKCKDKKPVERVKIVAHID